MKRVAFHSFLLATLSATAFAETRAGELEQPRGSRATGPEAIVGGNTVASGAWPDAVALMGRYGSCTGTLIAPDVVITAGHCEDAELEDALIGTLNFKADSGQSISISSVTAYPNWLDTYDIAVVVLSRPVQGIQPRKVAAACTFNTGWANSSMVKVVGFGATTRDADDDNSALREVAVPLTDADCSNGDGCNPEVSPNGEFTAGGNNLDSCNGDSGGPVYLETSRGPILVGAVSRAVNSSESYCGDGGIYVRVDKVVDWIEETTGKQIVQDDCSSGGGEPDGSGGSGGGDDDDDGSMGSDTGGGCSTGGGSSGLVALGFLALAQTLRRRR